ncbi:MAG: hypothetical protein M5R40_29395 [Anaerolineae bacterium]|nr:hypothetical protein [Anaerolineae bacterium]
MEVLRRLQLTPGHARGRRRARTRSGFSSPRKPRAKRTAHHPRELSVLEEKGRSSRHSCSLNGATQRPTHGDRRQPMRSAAGVGAGAMRPSRLIEIVAAVCPPCARALDRHEHVRDFTAPELLSKCQRQRRACRTSAPAARTTPAPRCPRAHRARAGIGCHCTNQMDRNTAGLIQMGAAKASTWAAPTFTVAPRSRTRDGTTAIGLISHPPGRVAARATLTYKILYNDAVYGATGGQPVDGVISAD